jgi:hypothetical protein
MLNYFSEKWDQVRRQNESEDYTSVGLPYTMVDKSVGD